MTIWIDIPDDQVKILLEQYHQRPPIESLKSLKREPNDREIIMGTILALVSIQAKVDEV